MADTSTDCGEPIQVPTTGLPLLTFCPDPEPVISVDAGATLAFRTEDACGGTVSSEASRVTLDGVGAPGGNPAAGPVEIRDAEPGDTLIVEILSIKLGESGFLNAFPGVGPLASRIATERTFILELSERAARRDGLEIPLRPMIGVIGVATATEEIANDFAGQHGGNLDNRFITTESRVYLPVHQYGAMLAIGDVHAAMGDGEATASGVETSAIVTVRVDLLKARQAEWPIVETRDSFYTHGVAATWDAAVSIAYEQAARQLEREWRLTPDEILLYLSAAADLGICQSARPGPFPIVARVGVARSRSVPGAFSPVSQR